MTHRTDGNGRRRRLRGLLSGRLTSRSPVESVAPPEIPPPPAGGCRNSTAATTPFSRVAEQYRSTAVALAARRREESLQTLLITSPLNGEGKTLMVLNLAAILSGERGDRVLAIDADLRRPSFHLYLGTDIHPGLVDAIEGRLAYADCVRPLNDTDSAVLTAGAVVANPHRLLTSEGFTQLLEWGTKRYQLILIDSPPVLPVADATVLGPRSDGALLVVALGEYQREVVTHALTLLRQSGTRIAGAVLTKVRQYLPYYLQRYETYPAYEAYEPGPTGAADDTNAAA